MCVARDAKSISINIKKELLWIVRGSNNSGVDLVGSGSSLPFISDLGILVGGEWHTSLLSISAAAGVAYTKIKIGTDYSVDTPYGVNKGQTYPIIAEPKTIGLAMEIHTVVTPFSFLGFGVGLIGNVNPKQSFLSEIGLTLRFGNL